VNLHETTGSFDAAAVTAVAQVMVAVSERKGEKQGAGTLPCPRCQCVLRYAFSRDPRMRGRQSVTARCDSDRCITFTGH
jgi:hypothetical protein